jgi:hypothetical protein
VRPITKIVDTFHGKKTSTVQLARVSTTYMRDVLGRIVVWLGYDARRRALERIDPRPNVQQRSSPEPASGISRRSAASSPRPRSGRTARSSTRPASMQTRLLLVDPPAMPAIPRSDA